MTYSIDEVQDIHTERPTRDTEHAEASLEPSIGARRRRPWTKWPNADPTDSAAAPAVGRSAWINPVALRETRHVLRGNSCSKPAYIYMSSFSKHRKLHAHNHRTATLFLFSCLFLRLAFDASTIRPFAVREEDQDARCRRTFILRLGIPTLITRLEALAGDLRKPQQIETTNPRLATTTDKSSVA